MSIMDEYTFYTGTSELGGLIIGWVRGISEYDQEPAIRIKAGEPIEVAIRDENVHFTHIVAIIEAGLSTPYHIALNQRGK